MSNYRILIFQTSKCSSSSEKNSHQVVLCGRSTSTTCVFDAQQPLRADIRFAIITVYEELCRRRQARARDHAIEVDEIESNRRGPEVGTIPRKHELRTRGIPPKLVRASGGGGAYKASIHVL